jgi:DNA-binding XRE family transcriptional regulator
LLTSPRRFGFINFRRTVLPRTSKKQTAGRSVALKINLSVPEKQLPSLKMAFDAILHLARLKFYSDVLENPTLSYPAKHGRPPKAKPATTAKVKKAPGRRPAGKKTSKIGALIRSLRTKAGMSQKALADKMGVYQNTVSLLELGKQKPNQNMAIKLEKALGTDHQKFLQ